MTSTALIVLGASSRTLTRNVHLPLTFFTKEDTISSLVRIESLSRRLVVDPELAFGAVEGRHAFVDPADINIRNLPAARNANPALQAKNPRPALSIVPP